MPGFSSSGDDEVVHTVSADHHVARQKLRKQLDKATDEPLSQGSFRHCVIHVLWLRSGFIIFFDLEWLCVVKVFICLSLSSEKDISVLNSAISVLLLCPFNTGASQLQTVREICWCITTKH